MQFGLIEVYSYFFFEFLYLFKIQIFTYSGSAVYGTMTS